MTPRRGGLRLEQLFLDHGIQRASLDVVFLLAQIQESGLAKPRGARTRVQDCRLMSATGGSTEDTGVWANDSVAAVSIAAPPARPSKPASYVFMRISIRWAMARSARRAAMSATATRAASAAFAHHLEEMACCANRVGILDHDVTLSWCGIGGWFPFGREYGFRQDIPLDLGTPDCSVQRTKPRWTSST